MRKNRNLINAVIIAALVPAMIAGSVSNIYAKEKDKEKKKEKKKIEADKDSFEEKEIPVFKGELTDDTITVRFYEDSPHVPYIGIKEYYDCIMKDSLDGEETMSVEKNDDNTYVLKSAHGEAVVDTDKDIMKSDNMSDFTNITCLVQEGICNTYCDGIPYVHVSETEMTGDGSVEFDFDKYNIEIYGDDKDVYFPSSTLSDIFTDLIYHFNVCNGETFYFNCNESMLKENIADVDPDYAKPIIEMLGEDYERPEDIIEYSYNELCFVFDHFYGFPGRAILNDELEEKGLEQAVTEYGEPGEKVLELLKSSYFPDYYCGVKKLQSFVDDSGHTHTDVIRLQNAVDDKLEKAINKRMDELEDIFEDIEEEVEKNGSNWKDYYGRQKIRDDVYKNEKYIKDGDTAVYVLDDFLGFDIDKLNKYYKEGGAKPTSLTMRNDDMVLIDECIREADADPDIKNFVIDCSNNIGGSLDEVAMLYCIVSGKREATFRMENALTGQKIKQTYEADTNFDKKFDENDEHEPYDLNIAVLTSANSFSCGNIFPSIMKDNGFLIMGEQSGGGACAVMIETTGEGMTYRISAYDARFLNKDGENIDSGIPVDVDLMVKRSDGKNKYITLKDVPVGSESQKMELRAPDYSEFYNIERLSEEINKFYKTKE